MQTPLETLGAGSFVAFELKEKVRSGDAVGRAGAEKTGGVAHRIQQTNKPYTLNRRLSPALRGARWPCHHNI